MSRSGRIAARARARTRSRARRSGSPMSSPVDIASAGDRRRTGRGGRCRGTRCRRGRAGWRTSPDGSLRRRSSRPTDTRDSRARGAPRRRSSPRCRRPSQNTGSAPSDTTAICASASDERRRPEHPERRQQHEERIGVTAEAARSARRWRRASTRAAGPATVLQTACTMFPRSNRPTRKVTNASRTTAKSTARPDDHRRPRPRASHVRAREPSAGRLDLRAPAAVTVESLMSARTSARGCAAARRLGSRRAYGAKRQRDSRRPRRPRASTPSRTASAARCPGVTTIASGTNQPTPDAAEQARRRRGEARSSGARRSGSTRARRRSRGRTPSARRVAEPRTTTAAEECATPTTSQRARATARRAARGRAPTMYDRVRVLADGILDPAEKPGIVDEPGESDHGPRAARSSAATTQRGARREAARSPRTRRRAARGRTWPPGSRR